MCENLFALAFSEMSQAAKNGFRISGFRVAYHTLSVYTAHITVQTRQPKNFLYQTHKHVCVRYTHAFLIKLTIADRPWTGTTRSQRR